MLSQKLKPTYVDSAIMRWYRDARYFLLDNWQRSWVLALWIGVMLGLFAYKFVQYRRRAVYEVMGHCVCMAKGAAETLKLNMALILLPVCRNTITWLRNKTKLGAAVPFDDNINFHKVIFTSASSFKNWKRNISISIDMLGELWRLSQVNSSINDSVFSGNSCGNSNWCWYTRHISSYL